MNLRNGLALASLATSLALTSCSTSSDIHAIADELKVVETKASSPSSVDSKNASNVYGYAGNTDSYVPIVIADRYDFLRQSKIFGSDYSQLNNNPLSNRPIQRTIDATIAGLEEGEKPGSSEAKRIAVSAVANEVMPALGAAVDWGYDRVDSVRERKRDLQRAISGLTGFNRCSISFSGNVLGQPRLGIGFSKKIMVFGMPGEWSVDFRKMSIDDIAQSNEVLSSENANPYERVLTDPPWSGSYSSFGDSPESMTLSMSFTFKF